MTSAALFAFSSLSVPFFLSFCCCLTDSCCLLDVINLIVFTKVNKPMETKFSSSCLVPRRPLYKLDRGTRGVVGLLQSETFDHEAVRALFSHCSPTKGNGTKETRHTYTQIPWVRFLQYKAI